MDASKLLKLSKSAGNCVLVSEKEVTFGLDKSHFQNLNLGAALYLNSMLHQYYPSTSGVLLGYDNLEIKKAPSDLHPDLDILHVNIKGMFYTFSPTEGSELIGRILSKTDSSVTIAIMDFFNVICLSPNNVSKLEIGSSAKVKITSVTYVNARIKMMGELLKVIADKSTDLPQSPLKRKQDLECKTPKKIKTSNENGKGTDDESSQESDKEDVFLKTPSKPTVNSTSNASKAPKTPKEKLVLPDGYTFIEKKTEKKKWKEFFGPDGKKYRSIVEIYKSLGENGESVSTPPPNRSEKFTKKLDEEIEEVASNWNIDENGDLEKNKNKFYNNMGLKKLPKNDRHFKDKKSLGKNSTNDADDIVFDQDETSKTLNDTHNSSMDMSQTSDVENVTQNESKKKKKKKKKNKGNE